MSCLGSPRVWVTAARPSRPPTPSPHTVVWVVCAQQGEAEDDEGHDKDLGARANHRAEDVEVGREAEHVAVHQLQGGARKVARQAGR